MKAEKNIEMQDDNNKEDEHEKEQEQEEQGHEQPEEERMNHELLDEGQSFSRDIVLNTNMGAMSSNVCGSTFKRKDGTLVVGGSRKSADIYLNKKGWSSLDDMRSEALAYKEVLLIERGITLPTGERVIVDPNNPEHIKLYNEQHSSKHFSIRDLLAGKSASRATNKDSVANDVALDHIYVDPMLHIPELINPPIRMKNEKYRGQHPHSDDTSVDNGPGEQSESGEAMNTDDERIKPQPQPKPQQPIDAKIGPRIPVNRTIFDVSEEDSLPTVERILLFSQLTNLPTMAPRLLSLLLGIPIPVVMDSFEIMRKYTVYINVSGCQWTFDRKPHEGYFDNQEQIDHFKNLVNNQTDHWLKAIEYNKDNVGYADTSSHARPRNKKSGAKKPKRTRDFQKWMGLLPGWFKNALITSIDGEAYMRKIHNDRNGKVPNDSDLEKVMAEFAWIQYQHRKKYLTLEYNRQICSVKTQVFNDPKMDDFVCSQDQDFLGRFLEITYQLSMETIRSMETLILRWNSKYIPVRYWEWLMTPLRKPHGTLVTDRYKFPAFIYRKQNEAIRDFMVHGDKKRFESICAEGSIEELEKPREKRRDSSMVNDYDGVTLVSLSRLYEFINVDSAGKTTIIEMSQRVYDIMDKVERMNLTSQIGQYQGDKEALKPLVKRMDDENIPNFYRPEYLKSEKGKQLNLDHRKMDESSPSSGIYTPNTIKKRSRKKPVDGHDDNGDGDDYDDDKYENEGQRDVTKKLESIVLDDQDNKTVNKEKKKIKGDDNNDDDDGIMSNLGEDATVVQYF